MIKKVILSNRTAIPVTLNRRYQKNTLTNTVCTKHEKKNLNAQNGKKRTAR